MADEPRYERVHRVLRRYDEHLDEAAKAFLKLFSAFRQSVDKDAFDKVFRVKREGLSLNAPIAALNTFKFQAMVNKLVAYRILRYDLEQGQYISHPLIRAHYFMLLTESNRDLAKKSHQQIKEYYLAMAQDLPDRPTLKDLMPLIEAVHHACHSGAYDEGFGICWYGINRFHEHYISYKLGAWETELNIMQEFFPGGDTSQEPLVRDPNDKAWIINEVGSCLPNIGQGLLAEGFFERALETRLDSKDWANASRVYLNLSSLYLIRGRLANGQQAAVEALQAARRAKSTQTERNSLACLAWAYHLHGDLKNASQSFLKAEELIKGDEASIVLLSSTGGIQHADHLRRQGEASYARRVTDANLGFCLKYNFPASISGCHRILGDLFADAGQKEEARESYDKALDIARSISVRKTLVEALLARGKWFVRVSGDAEAAIGDLTEAFEYARAGGYRLYEADIRIGLAWAHLAADNVDLARDQAEYALQMSQDMGYHWGIVDAKEVLAKLNES